MVPLEERTRVWWFFTRVRLVGWCCIECDRIADEEEPKRQWLASWAPLRVPVARRRP